MINGAEANLVSTQFTEVFVEQLTEVLVSIPSHHAGGMSSEGLASLLNSRVGVGQRVGRGVVSGLAAMRLIVDVGGTVGRSPVGDRVCREMRSNGSQALAQEIIRSGLMADQIRRLRRVLRRSEDGYLCGRFAAQAAAPQLVGLLGRMSDVVLGGQIVVGRDSGLELDSVWNEIPPSSRIPWSDIEKRRKAIGDRAELYSIQVERSAGVGLLEQINWVSRDDDSLGFDIEVVGEPTRYVEVKGSAGRHVRFLLSANEFSKAQLHGSKYEIHYWGEIDIGREPVEEYEVLKAAGYPLRVANPALALLGDPWIIEPAQYRVSLSQSL